VDELGGPAFQALRTTGPDEDGVLDVELRGAAPGNRVTPRLHAELAAFWPALARRPDVRCVLLRGAPDAFGAGSHPDFIASVVDGDGTDRARMHVESRDIVLGALECETPVVAAVRGAAMGAALATALLADVCVVAEDARLADGHARVGVPAGDHAVLLWPILCGMANAKRLLLLPESFSGLQAREMGLVAEAVPDAEVEPRARELAVRLAAQSTYATRWTKRALSHWYRLALPAFESSLAHEMLAYGTPAAREGITSLVEGRAPRFREAGA
jgi:enoyl-CoA hydratase